MAMGTRIMGRNVRNELGVSPIHARLEDTDEAERPDGCGDNRGDDYGRVDSSG